MTESANQISVHRQGTGGFTCERSLCGCHQANVVLVGMADFSCTFERIGLVARLIKLARNFCRLRGTTFRLLNHLGRFFVNGRDERADKLWRLLSTQSLAQISDQALGP
jgi:hypothetical protein